MAESVTAALIFQTSQKSGEDEELTGEAIKRIRSLFPDIILFSNYPSAAWEFVEGNVSECLIQTLNRTASNDQDSALLFYDFYPLLDVELTREIQDTHFKYLAHFTYSENIPAGLIPDLASLEFIKALSGNAPADMREFIFKNINRFDVEIFFKMPDIRQHRLDLSSATSRSRRMVHDLILFKTDTTFANFENLLKQNPEVMRPYPSYFEIELTTDLPFKPDFLPEREEQDSITMKISLIDKLTGDIQSNGLENDITIAIGGLGEPLLHPESFEIIKKFLELKQVRRLYLETYGYLIDEKFINSLQLISGTEKLEIIFRLTTLKKDRYRKLYGSEMFDRVLENISYLEGLPPEKLKFKVHAEIFKIKEVEDEISEYFDRFDNSPFNVILQKYNSYIGMMKERRVSDLTPLHRDFCWHLARDIYITAAGMVPLCKQDPFGQGKSAIDFRTMTIPEIITKTGTFHAFSIRGEHDKIAMPCLKCDEWYTFILV